MNVRERAVSISARLEPGRQTTVEVTGELEFSTHVLFTERLVDIEDTRPSRITVDLGGVTFMDSAGLHAVMDLAKRALKDGWELRLRNLPPKVERLFELTGVRARLPIENELS